MAPIVHTVEISRSPEDVFAYLADVERQPEWQEGVVSVGVEDGGPMKVGARVRTTRRVGRGERTFTVEATEYDPPRSFAFRGIDGPIRPIGKGTVEPVAGGVRSRHTFELDFEAHGIGKLLVPLVVRRQARKEMSENHRRLKERLESGSP